MSILPIGIAAGLLSALLMVAVAKATPLAMLLFLLAPLPVLIATLGWQHRAGLVAAIVGGLGVAIGISPLQGVAFALATALPAWWLGYLALLGRPAADGTIEWYPTGRLLAWVAATAAVTILAAAFVSATDFQTFDARWKRVAEMFLREQMNVPAGTPLPPIGGEPAERWIERFSRIAPLFAAQGFALILTIYLWLGAKTVAVSGRLPRPWPYIPGTMMPPWALLALAGGFLLANLGGFPGLLGFALVGGFATAFGLQGLAAMHDLTQGRPLRGLLLASLYLVLFLSQGLFFLPLALFAMADTAFGLRRRLRPGPPPRGP